MNGYDRLCYFVRPRAVIKLALNECDRLCYFVRPRAVFRISAQCRLYPYDGQNATFHIHNLRMLYILYYAS